MPADKTSFKLKLNKNKNIFYNYQADDKLISANGVEVATFTFLEDGPRPLYIPDGVSQIKGLGCFKQYYPNDGDTTYRMLLYGDDKRLYYNLMFKYSYNFQSLFGISFDTAPIVLSYKKDDLDTIIMSSQEKMYVWQTNHNPKQLSNVPIITSMCMNEGVLFCTIKEPAFKIWYCKDLNPELVGTNDDVSGYVSLQDDLGYARKVISFDEDVYVVRDYGISKINIYKDEVKVSMVYQSNTLIYTNTVSICGNSLLFFTKDGLHVYNGAKVVKQDINLNTILRDINPNAVASSLGDIYYLATNIDFSDGKQILCENGEYTNNVLIMLNTQDLTYQILRGVDVVCFLPFKSEMLEEMYFVLNGVKEIVKISKNSKYFDENLPKLWQNCNIFENCNKKVATKLTVYASKNVTFALKFNDKSLTFTTKKSGLNEFHFKRLCNTLQITITSQEEDANVDSMEITYYDC